MTHTDGPAVPIHTSLTAAPGWHVFDGDSGRCRTCDRNARQHPVTIRGERVTLLAVFPDTLRVRYPGDPDMLTVGVTDLDGEFCHDAPTGQCSCEPSLRDLQDDPRDLDEDAVPVGTIQARDQVVIIGGHYAGQTGTAGRMRDGFSGQVLEIELDAPADPLWPSATVRADQARLIRKAGVPVAGFEPTF